MHNTICKTHLDDIAYYAALRYGFSPRACVDIDLQGQVFLGSEYVATVRGENVIFDRAGKQPVTVEIHDVAYMV